MILELPDLSAMTAFGERIAARLRPGDIVALEGDLGVGKTTLARAILEALGHCGEIPSPTFSIIETYGAPPLRLPVVHADFYRIEESAELREIGLDDYRDGAALIVEWPEKVGGFEREAGCLSIRLETVGQARKAIVQPGADWIGRMP